MNPVLKRTSTEGADMVSKTIAKAATVSYDELTEEVKAVMDRAVRASRGNYWCDIFDRFAPAIFGVSDTDVVDSDGFSCRGFDREGFNTEGWDLNGYNRDGFDHNGFDKNGFDKEGFNRRGMNKDGFDRQGRDKYRFDIDGFDQEGYDYSGNRRRASREWYTAQSAKPETDFVYDANGYARPAEKKTAKQRLGL